MSKSASTISRYVVLRLTWPGRSLPPLPARLSHISVFHRVEVDVLQRDPDFQARVDAHYARQTQRKNRAEAEGETEEVVDVEEDDYDEG